jgi:hypothetical protein
MNQPFVVGDVETPVGKVPRVASVLRWRDHWGTFKTRWGVGRMDYKVDPGLYALGNPAPHSSVFVTANYKMSFDCLRAALGDQDAWILVLDTKGVNVWCAAGKGTFGTRELIQRIQTSGLEKIVEHRNLILPQLGAPGVAAHEVKKFSRFKATYGPIRAEDIPAFLAAGMRATPEMRRKTFTLWERTELIPIELMQALKSLAAILPLFFILGGLTGSGGFWLNAWNHGFYAILSLLIALVMGAVVNPLLLPYLPGRAFALKGLFLGGLGFLLLLEASERLGFTGIGWGEKLALGMILSAVAAFLAMNFTGTSTYTSLSGVKKEMRWAVPLEIAGGGVGVVLWLGALFIKF